VKLLFLLFCLLVKKICLYDDDYLVFYVNISFPSCISLIAVSLSFVAVSIFFFSFVAVSIFFWIEDWWCGSWSF